MNLACSFAKVAFFIKTQKFNEVLFKVAFDFACGT